MGERGINRGDVEKRREVKQELSNKDSIKGGFMTRSFYKTIVNIMEERCIDKDDDDKRREIREEMGVKKVSGNKIMFSIVRTIPTPEYEDSKYEIVKILEYDFAEFFLAFMCMSLFFLALTTMGAAIMIIYLLCSMLFFIYKIYLIVEETINLIGREDNRFVVAYSTMAFTLYNILMYQRYVKGMLFD
jgi:hypothetical protein